MRTFVTCSLQQTVIIGLVGRVFGQSPFGAPESFDFDAAGFGNTDADSGIWKTKSGDVSTIDEEISQFDGGYEYYYDDVVDRATRLANSMLGSDDTEGAKGANGSDGSKGVDGENGNNAENTGGNGGSQNSGKTVGAKGVVNVNLNGADPKKFDNDYDYEKAGSDQNSNQDYEFDADYSQYNTADSYVDALFDLASVMSEVSSDSTSGTTNSELGQKSLDVGRPNAQNMPGNFGNGNAVGRTFTGTAGISCFKCDGTLAHCQSNQQVEYCQGEQGSCYVEWTYRNGNEHVRSGCKQYTACQATSKYNFVGNFRTYQCNPKAGEGRRGSVCHQCCTGDFCFSAVDGYTDSLGGKTAFVDLANSDWASLPNPHPNA